MRCHVVVGVDVFADVLGGKGEAHLLPAIVRVELAPLCFFHHPAGFFLHVHSRLWHDVLEAFLHLFARAMWYLAVFLMHEASHSSEQNFTDNITILGNTTSIRHVAAIVGHWVRLGQPVGPGP